MVKWMRILWPSFLVAGVAEMVFFAFFDPMELTLFGQPLSLSRTGVYSLGFFLLWLFAAVSSWLTSFLERGAGEPNRCALPAADRPEGCTKRG